jgi:hypothetical protein
MTEHPLREPNQIRADCDRKLKTIETGGMFAALLAALLDEDWTTPRIEELFITSGRFILARTASEPTHKLLVREEADVIRNMYGIAKVPDWTATSWATCSARLLKPEGLSNWARTAWETRAARSHVLSPDGSRRSLWR